MNLKLIVYLFLIPTIYVHAQYIKKVGGNLNSLDQSDLNDTLRKKESSTTDYIGVYQKYISGIRGQECPMYPSCSNFGIKTFSETNFALAFVLTSDRLLRCGHDRNNYSLTLRSNGFKLLDYPAYDNAPDELYYTYNSYSFAYSDSVKDDSAFFFVKKLINNSYYQEALLEIMRSELQSSFNIELFINKMICLKAIGEYEKALFEYATKCPIEHKEDPELLFQIALIEYKLKNFDLSIIKDSTALEFCNDRFLRARLFILGGLLYANKYDWENSLLYFRSLSNIESNEQLSASYSLIVENGLYLKDKSPLIAGVLSIIPGAGYAYTGHTQTAISSLIINGLLTYATYSNFKKENFGMGLLTGVFNLSFYIANIYGSAKSANRFNQQQRKNIISKLEFNTNL